MTDAMEMESIPTLKNNWHDKDVNLTQITLERDICQKCPKKIYCWHSSLTSLAAGYGTNENLPVKEKIRYHKSKNKGLDRVPINVKLGQYA